MKKKLLTFLLAICLIFPCMFLLVACGDTECEHVWSVTREPSISMDGQLGCKECGQNGAVLPKLNNIDYEVNSTNPDYITYTYTKDGNSYKFCTSNFEFNYTVSESGEVKSADITGYNGTNTEIVIPDMVVSFCDEVPVESISHDAFSNNNNITSVILPSSILRIDYNAFYGCSQLSNINFEEGLEQIGSESFSGTALTEVVIPDSVTRIGSGAFAGCNLEKISLPINGHSTRIGSLFGSNPNSNEDVPDSLKEVILTGDGDSIDVSMFEGCDKIEKVVLNDEVESLDASTFARCTSLKEVVLGTSLKTIGNGIFWGCTALEDIMLPATVEFIDDGAFYNCTALETVYYEGTRAGWNNINIVGSQNNRWLTDATRYYYSETKPTGQDFIDNNFELKLWHYGENNAKEIWTINETTYVDGKSFEYAGSEVDLSDEYWYMLEQAEAQGMLEMLFDNDAEQIELVTSSANKEEYEGKLATYYASYATALTLSFADGIITLEQLGDNVNLGYIEIDGEVYYTLTKSKGFTYNATNGNIYEELISEYFTIRHLYSLAD